jgi:uncharacterized protein YjbI with pentapeptide repeats
MTHNGGVSHKRGTVSLQKNMFNQPVDSARELLVRYNSGERVFKGASLNRVNLQGACLAGISLIEADLVKANLSGTDLHASHLEKSNLRGANLEGANLEGSYLEGADLEGTNFDGTMMPDGRVRWRGITIM